MTMQQQQQLSVGPQRRQHRQGTMSRYERDLASDYSVSRRLSEAKNLEFLDACAAEQQLSRSHQLRGGGG